MTGDPGTSPDPVTGAAAVVPRDDVRLREADGWVYVCGSAGPPLRWRPPERGVGPGGQPEDRTRPDRTALVADDLPGPAVAALLRRGLLVPVDEPLRRHPSYREQPPVDAVVRVFGDDPRSARVAERVAAAGVPVHWAGPVVGGAGPANRPRAGTDPTLGIDCPPAEPNEPAAGGREVLVVSLTAADELVTAAAARAIGNGAAVVVHAAAGGTAYWAALWPPVTACPVCVTVRIRASRADRTLGRLGPRVTLGATGPDEATAVHWPTDEAAVALVAHQALRVLTGPPDGGTGAAVAELIALDLDEASTVRHPLLHTPGCPACRHAVTEPPDEPGKSLARSWQRMQPAIDPLTGIVSGLAVLAPDGSNDSGSNDSGSNSGGSNSGGSSGSGVDCTVVWAQGGTDTSWFSSVRASTVGGATKADPLAARVCAVGEILERYAAGIHRPEMFVRATLAQLGADAVDPRELPLGSPREYREVPELAAYHPDRPIDWVRGRSLVTGRPRYLPAAAVYVPYRAPHRDERLLHPNSTGLAAGSHRAHATLGGLLEVIERDAAAVCWYNRLVTPTLDWTSAPPRVARVLRRIERRGVRLLAKDITTDLGVPAVLLLGRFTGGGCGDRPGRPAALCGFRADTSLAGCLLGAAQELEHLLAMYRRSLEQGRPPVPDPAVEPRDIWDFATYYCHESRVGALGFLEDGPVLTVPDGLAAAEGTGFGEAGSGDTGADSTDRVRRLVDRLHRHGHEAVVVDITPIDVAECGVRVVRTVVPGLQPVSFHRRFRHLGGRRLFRAPVRMGLRHRELTEDQLNPDPIPLG